MKDVSFGKFEELVLLAIGTLDDNAYSISIKNLLSDLTNKPPSIGALHSALTRLEKKGFISSYEGESTKERGGRRKRLYIITVAGKEALAYARLLREQLYAKIPGISMAIG